MKSICWSVILGLACVHGLLNAQTINVVTDLGAFNDGTNATVNWNVLGKAFYNNPNGKLMFPPGDYAIDNSLGAITINNFNGEIKFEGNARLLFQDNSKPGLHFNGGTGMRIDGLNGNYPNNPTARVAAEFAWTGGADIFIKNIVAQNAPGSAIELTNTIRPKIMNASVTNTLADGVQLENCTDVVLSNVTTVNTADNGVALYNYSTQPDGNGGSLSNIKVVQSQAHGIAVLGTSNVTVSGFVIDGTRGSAIFVGQDFVYATRVSDHVVIEHGIVLNAGSVQPTPANSYGIEFNQPISAIFSDIEIVNNIGRAVSGTGPTSRIYLRNIRTINNTKSDAFSFNQTGLIDVSDCVAINSAGAGFSFTQVPMVIARRLKAINAAQSTSLHRAFWFQNGSHISASDLIVIDDQPTPTGYVVGTSNSTGYAESGSIHNVTSSIANGKLVVNNYAPAVSIQGIY